MQWRLDCGRSSGKWHRTDDGLSGAYSWLRGAVPGILMAAGVISMVSCSKISLPQTAQDGSTPASSDTAQTAFSFLPSFNNPPASANSAQTGSVPSPAGAPPSVAARPRGGVFQPNPATGAKEAAMKMYPQLAVKDSTFNKVFRDLYAEEMQKNPESLTKADWPLTLAYRTANLLAAKPVTSAAPPPPIAEARPTRATPTPPTALNRGAYNQARSPWWWGPWTRYY
jgi:hypothetical protein